MSQLTIKIAPGGIALNSGGRSTAGHVWYELTDNAGKTTSYGFAPATSGAFSGEGSVHTDDNVKRAFLEAFEPRVLRPRGLSYRFQFPGPTGTNCVEAALKLARKFTRRTSIVAFTNGFHGVSMGALSATGSSGSRSSVAGLLNGITRLYYDGFAGAGIPDL